MAAKGFRETIETANQWTRGRQGRAKSHGSGPVRVTLRFNPERAATSSQAVAKIAHRAARFLEYGTVKMRARPWLWSAFFARSPSVKHSLRRLLAAAFKSRRGAV
jgi:hypothetical protein